MSATSLAQHAQQSSGREVHHAAPRCLLRLHDAAECELRMEGAGAWLEFEHECVRWGVPVEISRDDLEAMIERSAVVLDREKHRHIHQSDWQRWGRRGGLATLRRYGTSWYSALALKRWGLLDAEDLGRTRAISHGRQQRSYEDRPCACLDGWVYIGVEEDGVERTEAVRCRRCAR